MYLGKIVEKSPMREFIEDPKHPYSQSLLKAIPVPNPHSKRSRVDINVMKSPEQREGLSHGCRFKDRCPERMEVCDIEPRLVETDREHFAACHLYYDHKEEAEIQEVNRKTDLD
jgi:peptide/nickel transport system ATP-binding protein